MQELEEARALIADGKASTDPAEKLRKADEAIAALDFVLTQRLDAKLTRHETSILGVFERFAKDTSDVVPARAIASNALDFGVNQPKDLESALDGLVAKKLAVVVGKGQGYSLTEEGLAKIAG